MPPGAEPAYQMYPVLLPEARRRDDVVAHLQAAGVDARFHYLPLHLSEMGRRLGGRAGQHPVTESVTGIQAAAGPGPEPEDALMSKRTLARIEAWMSLGRISPE